MNKARTIRVGTKRGFNAEVLMSMTVTEAYKRYPKVDKATVKSAHDDAMKLKKDDDAPSEEEKSED